MRNFIYVTDVAEAFDVVVHKGVPGQIYNIGTDTEVSVIEMATTLIKKVTKWQLSFLLCHILSLGQTPRLPSSKQYYALLTKLGLQVQIQSLSYSSSNNCATNKQLKQP